MTVKGLDTVCFTLQGSNNNKNSSKRVKKKKKKKKDEAYLIYDIYKVKKSGYIAFLDLTSTKSK